MPKPKLLHIITGLQIGGAEAMLIDLIAGLKDQFDQEVIYFHHGPHAARLANLGVKAHQVKGLLRTYDPVFLYRFYKLTRSIKPNVIHSSLWSAGLLGRWVAKRLNVPVVCAIHSLMGLDGSIRDWLDKQNVHVAAQYIAVSGSVAQSMYAQTWLPAKKIVVIRNGIDANAIVARSEQKRISRTMLGIPEDAFVVGSVGRFIASKRYDVLIGIIGQILCKPEAPRPSIHPPPPARPDPSIQFSQALDPLIPSVSRSEMYRGAVRTVRKSLRTGNVSPFDEAQGERDAGEDDNQRAMRDTRDEREIEGSKRENDILPQKSIRDIHLVLIGHGPEEQNLRQLTEQLNLQTNVHFIKDFPAYSYYPIFDSFALPSVREGLSMALLEAMSCGLPSIVTGAGNAHEVIQHDRSGLVIPPDDSEALFQALKKLAEHPNLRASMGAAAANYVRTELSHEKMVRDYAQIFKGCV